MILGFAMFLVLLFGSLILAPMAAEREERMAREAAKCQQCSCAAKALTVETGE